MSCLRLSWRIYFSFHFHVAVMKESGGWGILCWNMDQQMRLNIKKKENKKLMCVVGPVRPCFSLTKVVSEGLGIYALVAQHPKTHKRVQICLSKSLKLGNYFFFRYESFFYAYVIYLHKVRFYTLLRRLWCLGNRFQMMFFFMDNAAYLQLRHKCL